MDQVKFGKGFMTSSELGKPQHEETKEPRNVDKARPNRTDKVGDKRPGTLKQQKKK